MKGGHRTFLTSLNSYTASTKGLILETLIASHIVSNCLRLPTITPRKIALFPFRQYADNGEGLRFEESELGQVGWGITGFGTDEADTEYGCVREFNRKGMWMRVGLTR